jgi:hypothetical protein
MLVRGGTPALMPLVLAVSFSHSRPLRTWDPDP